MKKYYVCHVDQCVFNKQGACNYDADCVTIALHDGVAQCPNYVAVDTETEEIPRGIKGTP